MAQLESRFVIARCRHQWACFSSQQGSLLVEVMVGALVLGITTLAVLSGLDGAQDTGARNKARSEYSVLAQQDIERLRSKPITSLSNYNETPLVKVGTVDYVYNDRLRYREPPYFLDPVQASWRISRETEQVPAIKP